MSGVKVDYEAMRSGAKPMPKAESVWVGKRPEDVVAGITYEQVVQTNTEALVGEEIVITGYSMREGKKGPFAVVACIPKASGEVSCFTIGGEVVLRKLKEAGEKQAFPVVGKLAKVKGRKSGNTFYDFVSE